MKQNKFILFILFYFSNVSCVSMDDLKDLLRELYGVIAEDTIGNSESVEDAKTQLMERQKVLNDQFNRQYSRYIVVDKIYERTHGYKLSLCIRIAYLNRKLAGVKMDKKSIAYKLWASEDMYDDAMFSELQRLYLLLPLVVEQVFRLKGVLETMKTQYPLCMGISWIEKTHE